MQDMLISLCIPIKYHSYKQMNLLKKKEQNCKNLQLKLQTKFRYAYWLGSQTLQGKHHKGKLMGHVQNLSLIIIFASLIIVL